LDCLPGPRDAANGDCLAGILYASIPQLLSERPRQPAMQSNRTKTISLAKP
jgi:hypothetical protein